MLINLPFINASDGKLNVPVIHCSNLSVCRAVDNSAPVITGNCNYYDDNPNDNVNKYIYCKY